MDAKAAATRAVSRREITLLVLALLLMGGAFGSLYYYLAWNARYQTWTQLTKDLETEVADLSGVGRDAARGATPDFRTLEADEESFGDNVQDLSKGNPDLGIPALPGAVASQIAAVDQAWQKMKQSVDAVLAGEAEYERTASIIAAVAQSVPTVYKSYEQIAERLATRGAPASQIYLAAGQLIRLERMQAAAARVLSQGRNAEGPARELEAHAREFVRVGKGLQDMLGGDPAANNLLKDAARDFEPLATAAGAIGQDAPAVSKLQENSAVLQGEAANVLSAAKTLEQGLLDFGTRQPLRPWMSYAAGGVAVAFLVLFVLLYLVRAGRQARAAGERDARTQQAILSLLDEITNLADGDLTVAATVTEDFTGAIADSINFTVGNMRSLVGTINDTAVEIAAAASGTQEIARKMNAASERQSKEIATVTNAITASSQSLSQVAGRAEQLATQAQGSVQTAHSGAETVGRTIQNMAALREQIQDTAKRIKRLGESSQEIGNIIEFINDIAEQTNTLALNASIQAAMAGEQGRGFAVVADEVQRLAERAGNATRQIENLVKTIQADTNEAIVSMERSTTNVVAGAKSAEEAGQALTKIEQSSQELSRLIQEISGAARNQSAQANKIAGTTQIIRDIAAQTQSSASETADAVGELNVLSEKLRQSVSGFKLPEEAPATAPQELAA